MSFLLGTCKTFLIPSSGLEGNTQWDTRSEQKTLGQALHFLSFIFILWMVTNHYTFLYKNYNCIKVDLLKKKLWDRLLWPNSYLPLTTLTDDRKSAIYVAAAVVVVAEKKKNNDVMYHHKSYHNFSAHPIDSKYSFVIRIYIPIP